MQLHVIQCCCEQFIFVLLFVLQLGASLGVVVKLLCRLLLTSPYLFTSVVTNKQTNVYWTLAA